MKNTTAVLKSIVNLKIIVFCQNYQNLNVENQLQRNNLYSQVSNKQANEINVRWRIFVNFG